MSELRSSHPGEAGKAAGSTVSERTSRCVSAERTGQRSESRPGATAVVHGKELIDDGVALLAQELRDVVHRQAGLARRARALPAAERLHARPRAGRRAG